MRVVKLVEGVCHDLLLLLLFSIVTAQLESLTGRVAGRQSDSASASEGGQQRDTVDQLELQFYAVQLELYDAKFEILKHEEQLLVAQIDSLRRQMKGGFDSVGGFMQAAGFKDTVRLKKKKGT